MKNTLALTLLSLVLGGAAAGQPPTPPPTPRTPPKGPIGILAQPPVPEQQKVPFDQAAALAQLRAQIAGHEKEPAETVFKDIKLLRGVPAENLDTWPTEFLAALGSWPEDIERPQQLPISELRAIFPDTPKERP